MPQSPYLFMAFLAIYLAAANLLMRYLPLFPGLVLSVALYLGHFWGSSSWINVIFHASSVQNSWYQHIAYAVAVALMTTGWIWWYLRMTKEKAR